MERHYPHILHYWSYALFILVGTKSDLKTDPDMKPVFIDQINKFIETYKIDGYFETSAISDKGVVELFGHAAQLVIDPSIRKTRRPILPTRHKLIEPMKIPDFIPKKIPDIHKNLKDFYDNPLFSDIKFTFSDEKSILAHKVDFFIVNLEYIFLDCSYNF